MQFVLVKMRDGFLKNRPAAGKLQIYMSKPKPAAKNLQNSPSAKSPLILQKAAFQNHRPFYHTQNCKFKVWKKTGSRQN